MEDWPKNGSPARFKDLANSVKSVIKFAYKLRRKNLGKSIPVVGIDAPETAVSFSGTKTLSSEMLKYNQEHQGRNALDEIIGFALKLGAEQGVRIIHEKQAESFKSLELLLKIIKTISSEAVRSDEVEDKFKQILVYLESIDSTLKFIKTARI